MMHILLKDLHTSDGDIYPKGAVFTLSEEFTHNSYWAEFPDGAQIAISTDYIMTLTYFEEQLARMLFL